MTAPGLTPPSPILAIGGDDAARVEQWVARQRAELSQLALAVRSAQVRAEKAEKAERADPSPEAQGPEELRSLLESMLDTAVREAESAVQAARRDGVATVAVEHERVSAHLRSLGLDPLVVIGPSGWTSSTIPDLERPASWGEFWQDVEVEARASGPTGSARLSDPDEAARASPAPAAVPTGHASMLRPSDDDVELVFDDAELVEAFWPAADPRPAAESTEDPEPMRASPDLNVMPSGHAPIPQTSEAELFEAFWGGAASAGGAERRRSTRGRWRRRAVQGQR